MLKKDSSNMLHSWKEGDRRTAMLLSVAVACEFIDLIAQCTITYGIAKTTGSLPTTLSMYGFAALPEIAVLMGIADKVSLASATISCIAGVTAEGTYPVS